LTVVGAGNTYVLSACTVTSLTVNAVVGAYTPSAADTTTFTVQKNNLNTPMTCSVSTTATAGNTASCSDTTHTFTVAVGDKLEYQYSQTNSNPAITLATALVCQ
jgi:hypothetical protein